MTNVRRNSVSSLDPRTEREVSDGGMTGGDRMRHHGYAPKYAQYLAPFVECQNTLVIAEFGILKGSGLAMWSELFPSARLLGFDIDLSHTRDNLEWLRESGAFMQGTPELHEYDQFVESSGVLGKFLKGDSIDICIDDGFHSDESILCTLKSVIGLLSDNFVYFIEDNPHVHHKIRELSR